MVDELEKLNRIWYLAFCTGIEMGAGILRKQGYSDAQVEQYEVEGERVKADQLEAILEDQHEKRWMEGENENSGQV